MDKTISINIKLDLSPIFIEDKKTKGYTSYFKEYPNAIGDGDTKDNSLKSLADAFSVMIANEPDILQPLLSKELHQLSFDNNHEMA